MIEALLVAIVGIAVGLLGYRAFHAWIGVFGFVLGAMLAFAIASPGAASWVPLVAALVGGLLGAWLASIAEWAAFFLAGAALGWVLGLSVGAALALGGLAPVVGLAGAIAGGVVGVMGERLVVTVGTAILGAWLTVQGAGAAYLGRLVDLQGPLPRLGAPWVAPTALLGLALVYAGLQFGEIRLRRRRRR